MQPLVSIIIPVYNAEKYVGETIQSALDQTWSNKEIIVVDDGSTDNSHMVADKFQDQGVKVIRQLNKGASAARNVGLTYAHGEYIQFLDAEDLLSPNKIEAQINVLRGFSDYLGLCTTLHFQDGDNHFDTPVYHELFSAGTDNPIDLLLMLYSGSMIALSAWLTPKSVIDKAGSWNEELSTDDDGEFFCRVVLASKGVKYAFDAVNYYRKFKSADTLSAKKTHKASVSILQSTRLKAQHLLKATNNPLAKKYLSRLFWESAFSLYPFYKELAKEAEKEATALDPYFKYRPFDRGIKGAISTIFGWKIIRQLQYLKAGKRQSQL